MTGHTAGKCVKMFAARSPDGLSAGPFAVEWCQTHQRPWDLCEDKRTNTLLLEALKELLPSVGFSNMSDDELRHEAELGNGVAPKILIARSAIAAATRSEK